MTIKGRLEELAIQAKILASGVSRKIPDIAVKWPGYEWEAFSLYPECRWRMLTSCEESKTVVVEYEAPKGSQFSNHRHLDFSETCVVMGGPVVVNVEDEQTKTLTTGDVYQVEKGKYHRARYTEKTNMILIFHPVENDSELWEAARPKTNQI
jgi:quercetin dioxygenase-like cupin family protein